MSFTIGSLFDGSGGFPLAASMCGGTPIWAAEVEPYPIAVTTSRFPNMKHLGSVTEVKGNEVEPVDVLCFGAPCQDLSVAGLRKGLRHDSLGDGETTRSGLFMEAVRIIKEMREATNGVYPRFAIYENVPGAFSSSKGQDFRIVLEELIKVVEPTAVMPEVTQNGWPYADSYCGEGWSLSYRTLDAQFWGVPQRRRRIYLVADFRGECAGKVSFEREGLRGYFETGRTPWQTVARDAESGSGTADCERKCYGIDHAITTGGNCTAQGKCVYEDIQATLKASGVHAVAYSINHQGGNVEQIIEDKTGTLTAAMNSSGNNKLSVAYSFDALSSNSMKSSNPHSGCRQVEVAKCLDTTDPNPSKNHGGIAIVEQVPYTLKIRSGCEGGGKGALIQTDKSATLSTLNDQYLFQPLMTCLDDQGGSQISVRSDGKCPTLRAEMHGNLPCVMSIENHPADSRVNIDDSGKVQTLTSRMGTGGGNVPKVMEPVAYNGENITSPLNKTNPQPGDPRHTLGTDSRNYVVARCIGNGQLNQISMAEQANTLDCMHDQQAVVYSLDEKMGQTYVWEGTANTLAARDFKQPQMVAFTTYQAIEDETPVVLDRAFFNQGQNALYEPQYYTDGTVPTLVAKGPSAVAVRYIVRRLTPTECARLQGFPDTWGHPDVKTELTDEEYQFWLNVRNTHAAINEKAVKEYTKDQMLKWYNGLHTDSSEYKMWGNGIALPNALYVMQGIADVMSEEKAARKKWLDDLLGGCL